MQLWLTRSKSERRSVLSYRGERELLVEATEVPSSAMVVRCALSVPLVRQTGSKLVLDTRRQRVLALVVLTTAFCGLAIFLTVLGDTPIGVWFVAVFFGLLGVHEARGTVCPVVDTQHRTLQGPVFAFFAQIGAVVIYRRCSADQGKKADWALGVAMPGPAAMASMQRQLSPADQPATPYRASEEQPPQYELRGNQVELNELLTVQDNLDDVRDAAVQLAEAIGVPVIDLIDTLSDHPDLSRHTFTFDLAAIRRDAMGATEMLSEAKAEDERSVAKLSPNSKDA